MLDPFDGAQKVRLPDGIECWEKETMTPCQGGQEPSYQYSVDTDHLALDYYGRVENLEVKGPDDSWTLVVNYFPVNHSAVSRLRDVINGGWAKKSELIIPKNVDKGVVLDRMMNAKGYLEIYTEVMDTIMGYAGGQE